MFFAYTGTFTFSPALPSTVPISISIAPDAGFDDVGADVGVCEPPLTVTVPFEALPLYSFSVVFEAASRDATETS